MTASAQCVQVHAHVSYLLGVESCSPLAFLLVQTRPQSRYLCKNEVLPGYSSENGSFFLSSSSNLPYGLKSSEQLVSPQRERERMKDRGPRERERERERREVKNELSETQGRGEFHSLPAESGLRVKIRPKSRRSRPDRGNLLSASCSELLFKEKKNASGRRGRFRPQNHATLIKDLLQIQYFSSLLSSRSPAFVTRSLYRKI